MMTPLSFYFLISAVLGLSLAIPSNTCIVIVTLGVIRKKGKLSPSDVIFMAKGMVNVLLQVFLSLQGMFSVLCPEVFYIGELYTFMISSVHFLMYSSFWMTVWLSAHYCTTITNLSYGFFIWLKRIVSNFLSQILFLTALGMFALCAPAVWALQAEYDRDVQSSENTTESFMTKVYYSLSFSYFLPVTFLGCVLPFCLTLLCLLLTFSFLLRHVWRVKNNDSGSSRPNLDVHVTALRTIFFLLFMFTSVFMSRAIRFLNQPAKFGDTILVVSWTLQLLSPSFEAVVIFQASNKLKRIILGKFWTRRRWNAEV
ncbi:PREDICTED: taste receptor type 2 member 7-like [Nanorana parkeri]|uniref:taste receptor type 2 member 7-like n=1 Tax=Nanorana parkeri TaxID=125878 RepID=UPI000854D7A0|nr:PREDICTED: taste receptor type 2 member 7-like [Nanorana parkeri]